MISDKVCDVHSRHSVSSGLYCCLDYCIMKPEEEDQELETVENLVVKLPPLKSSVA